ncbi:PEP/pyruvate-binding domain-containing protein [Sphingomonas sp. ZT3P38]|uniref:PEP/pyruvate-binding domain-containing protein n=1 Tax=Parasphingomonas zepuensis TaxID=3096161 RepID=UPI002FC5BFC7
MIKRFAILLGLAAASLSAPAVVRSLQPDPAPAPQAGLRNDAEFDRLARTEGSGRFLALPQLMFAIDRAAVPPRALWIDTKRYRYHLEYLQAKYMTLADSEAFNAANYSNPKRRFLLGSVVRYPRLNRYGVELWEGDVVEPALLADMMRLLQAGFHAPLTFKPNSDQQREAAGKAKLPTIGVDEAYGSREELILNHGRAVGRLVVVKEGQEDGLTPGDIAVLTTMPIRMPPVAGIVSATFTTPINHISLLAKTWRIPNAYRADADRRWASLAGQMVVLDTRGAMVVLRKATLAEVKAAERAKKARAVQVAQADAVYTGLPSLVEQDAGWARRTGAKAANLGQVAQLAKRDGRFTVPPGFGIPFSFYDRFVAANQLGPRIAALLADPRRTDPAWRQAQLAKLRAAFLAGAIPDVDFAGITSRRAALLGPKGVFVRSSTNAEDLRGFNGAGLYDTVPNVVSAADLARAVKTVWGSIWNDRAFAAREAAGIDHRSVRAAVLIQIGVDADAAGVMTTIDPFDERQADEIRIFIAAKRGLGIRVVEGRKIAEQLIYRPQLDSVQVLTRSKDDVVLHFSPGGGVEEMKTDPDRAVLSDDLVRRLGMIGSAIEGAFNRRPQDIEWLVVGDRIMIVQSRDYVRGQ